MQKRLAPHFILLLAMLLGLISGFSGLPFLNSFAETTSDLFLRVLKLISLPIVFLSITATVSGMKDFQEMRRMGRKIVVYTLGTTIAAATIALILFVTIQPAREGALLVKAAEAPIQQGSYLSFALNAIPSNLVQAFLDNNVIGVAFIALLLSCTTLMLPTHQKEFLNQLFSSLFAATLKITGLLIKFMPLAIWAFVTLLVKEMRGQTTSFSTLLLYLLCVVSANLIQGLVVLPLLLKFKKISPTKLFSAMAPALGLAFFSKSSAASLPLTMRCLEERAGVSRKVSSLTLPLCSVINMNGCAAFILITTLFVSTMQGVHFNIIQLVGWIFLATLAAVGNAGVPMGCFFLTSAFLIGMKVPLYLMGLILPFYTLLDMVETALNVWSDGCVTIAVDRDLQSKELPAPQEAS